VHGDSDGTDLAVPSRDAGEMRRLGREPLRSRHQKLG